MPVTVLVALVALAGSSLSLCVGWLLGRRLTGSQVRLNEANTRLSDANARDAEAQRTERLSAVLDRGYERLQTENDRLLKENDRLYWEIEQWKLTVLSATRITQRATQLAIHGSDDPTAGVQREPARGSGPGGAG